MTTYGSKPNWVDKVGFIVVMFAMVLLLVTLSQPAWRGEEMIAELKSDCQKVGGVMLEHKKMFGTTYECSPRFDKGVE